MEKHSGVISVRLATMDIQEDVGSSVDCTFYIALQLKEMAILFSFFTGFFDLVDHFYQLMYYIVCILMFLIFIISLSSLLFLYIWTKVTPHKNRRHTYLTHLRGLGYVQIFTNVQTFCEFLQKCIWKSRFLIRTTLMKQIYGLFKAFLCPPEEGI